jgi:hypothetical protein
VREVDERTSGGLKLGEMEGRRERWQEDEKSAEDEARKLIRRRKSE